MEYENEINFATNSKKDMSKWTYPFNIVLYFLPFAKFILKMNFVVKKMFSKILFFLQLVLYNYTCSMQLKNQLKI